MNSKFCKTQLYSSHSQFFITKLYTIFYYIHYFLLFSKVTYYFVWRNLPTNSNYFTKIYLLFSVTLIISNFTRTYIYVNDNILLYRFFFSINYLTFRKLPDASFHNYFYLRVWRVLPPSLWLRRIVDVHIAFGNYGGSSGGFDAPIDNKFNWTKTPC